MFKTVMIAGCAVAVSLTVGLAALASPPSQLKQIKITGSKLEGTRNCKGAKALLYGNDSALTLRKCSKVVVLGNTNKLKLVGVGALEVPGNKNRVSAGHVASISTMGNNNTVTYKLGKHNKKPRISNLGKGNKIRKE